MPEKFDFSKIESRDIKGIIEIIVRAVIINNGKILLCKQKMENCYFLPGGHVKFGESLKKALMREIKEELNMPLKDYEFLGNVENWYGTKKHKRHEINFVYKVSLKNGTIKTTENHIEFYWKIFLELNRVKFLPIQLKKRLLNLMKNKEF